MIIGIIDLAIFADDQAFCSAETTMIIHIAFNIGGIFRQLTFIVAKSVSTDGFARRYLPQVALGADPAEVLRFGLGNVVGRQFAI